MYAPLYGETAFFLADTPTTRQEWLFTHSCNEEISDELAHESINPSRPVLLFRVVRSPLHNVEAYYRYLQREQGGQLKVPWVDFAQEKIIEYRAFHKYWASQCDKVCCLTVTYEDLQDADYLQAVMQTLLKMWLPDLKPEEIEIGVNEALRVYAPKNHATNDQFESKNQYNAGHLLALLGVQS